MDADGGHLPPAATENPPAPKPGFLPEPRRRRNSGRLIVYLVLNVRCLTSAPAVDDASMIAGVRNALGNFMLHQKRPEKVSRFLILLATLPVHPWHSLLSEVGECRVKSSGNSATSHLRRAATPVSEGAFMPLLHHNNKNAATTPPVSEPPERTAPGPVTDAESGPARPAPRGAPATRTSVAWVGVWVAAIVLIAFIVFILQNTRSVQVSYLGVH